MAEGGKNPSHLLRNTFDVFHFDTSVINRISVQRAVSVAVGLDFVHSFPGMLQGSAWLTLAGSS